MEKIKMPNCYICGKFVGSNKSFYKWTDHGSYENSEPPEPNLAHEKCYENYKHKQQIYDLAWIKPSKIDMEIKTNEM